MADEKEAVMAEEKKSSNNKIVIILIIVIVLLVAGGVTFFILNGKKPAESGTTSGKQIPLEVNAGVLNPDKMKEWNESVLAEMEDYQIPIAFSPTAISQDGENFSCEIGNPPGAKYYIYLDMYSDTTLSEEVYLSGLLEPGQGITTFKTNRAFPKGETDIVLVISTVQDDRETMVAQTMVALTLQVAE